MHRRINITLPEETVELIDRISERGDRSRLINQAVRLYVHKVGRAQVRRRLREGYRKGAASDRKLAEAWFFLDEEAGQREIK